MAPEVFSFDALPANRRGELTPSQRTLLGLQARDSRRSGLQAGVALLGFGGLLIFGAVSGRVESGRFGALAIGLLMAAIGTWLLKNGGLSRTGKASVRAATGEGGVVAVSGELRKERVDRSVGDELLGLDTSHRSGNRWQYLLHVGARRLEVNQAQFDVAPAGGPVTAYLLAGTDHIVNLERRGVQ
jgi:hypothetical protein